MDVFLLIMSLIILVILIISNVYILAVYCHPDDSGFGANLMCQIVVVLGLTLSWAQVLLLPLDVSNSRGAGGELPMDTIYNIVYTLILVIDGVVIPFCIFYYQSDEEKTFLNRICSTLLWLFVLCIILGLIIGLSYFFLSFSEIPVQIYTIDASTAIHSSLVQVDPLQLATFSQRARDSILEISVSFYIYLMGLMSFFGNFFLILFGGAGLSVLPIELIKSFTNRPILRTPSEIALQTIEYRKQLDNLLQLGNEIKRDQENYVNEEGWWARRKLKKNFEKELNVLNYAALQLEQEFSIFSVEQQFLTEQNPIIAGFNPFFHVLNLIGGIFGIFISILWWIHILLFMVMTTSDGFPFHSFLNVILLVLENQGINFLSVTCFGILNFYMLWAIIQGNFQVGVKIPFLFTLHPMVPNETWMNSFLFNISLILICSVSLTHFSAIAFSQYMRMSSIDMIFGIQVWSGVTAIYFIAQSAEKPQVVQEMEQRQVQLQANRKQKKEIQMTNLLEKQNIEKQK